MAITLEETVSTGKKFDSLAAYKEDFFEVFAELITDVIELRDIQFFGKDSLDDWMMIELKLEILTSKLRHKIINKVVA